VVRWRDERGEHAEIVVRDTEHWIYRWFEIDPKRPVTGQVLEHLKLKPEELKVPDHIKLEKTTEGEP